MNYEWHNENGILRTNSVSSKQVFLVGEGGQEAVLIVWRSDIFNLIYRVMRKLLDWEFSLAPFNKHCQAAVSGRF